VGARAGSAPEVALS